jgi:hypothetical protein
MRTALFIVAGLALVAASMLLGRLFSTHYPTAPMAAFVTFAVIWLVIAGANMWVGVQKAGYSIGEELPIFVLIFLLPAAAGAFFRWRGWA